MAKRRYFKKSIKSAVTRAISKYQRRKMCYVCALIWNDGTMTIDGQNQQALSIGDILSGNTSEFQTLGKQYGQVKLRGIAIDAVCNKYTSGYNMGLALGQANDSIVFDNIRTQPNVMILDVNSRTRSYIPIGGEFTATNSIQLFTNMKLAPFMQGQATAFFTIKITLYLTFKTTL